jgi:hypothetical protein
MAARQARSGWPRWKNDATKPSVSNIKLTGNASLDINGAEKTGASKLIKAKKNNSPCAMPARVVKKIIEN